LGNLARSGPDVPGSGPDWRFQHSENPGKDKKVALFGPPDFDFFGQIWPRFRLFRPDLAEILKQHPPHVKSCFLQFLLKVARRFKRERQQASVQENFHKSVRLECPRPAGPPGGSPPSLVPEEDSRGNAAGIRRPFFETGSAGGCVEKWRKVEKKGLPDPPRRGPGALRRPTSGDPPPWTPRRDPPEGPNRKGSQKGM